MRFYAPSQMRSVKDKPGFTKLKYRQDGQNNRKDLSRKDQRLDLQEREREHFSKLSREEFICMFIFGYNLFHMHACTFLTYYHAFLSAAEREKDIQLLEYDTSDARRLSPDEDDADEEDSTGPDDSSDEETDEEAELLAELERIKQERAVEAAKAEVNIQAEEEERARAEVSGGNPLLHNRLASHSDFRIKRRWDDDVVFRNQATKEPIKQARFINDTIRNDFHKRFLDRYMR